MKPLRLLGLSLLLLALGGCAADVPYTNLDNQNLQSMLEQGVPLVDIRRPDEWRQTGVVEGSQKITFVDGRGRLMPDFFDRFTREVGKDEPVILICRTGNRTNVLARHLMTEMGYTQVYNVRRGISSWIREGRPVVRTQG